MTKTSSGSRPSTLDEALDYFCIDRTIKGAHVPDYVGFTNWMFEEGEKTQATLQLPLHALTSSEPTRAALEFWRQFLATAASAGIEIDDNGHRIDPETFPGKHGGRSKHKSINRAKLMFQYIHEAPKRLQSFLVLLQKPAANHVTRSSPQGSATQLEHRSAFFAAVARGDAPTAFKMLGRLREEEHDIGELEFLEATAYFHSNNFEEAIQYAEKVPKDSIDWPRAILIVLESFAMQGNLDRILRKLADAADIRVPKFFAYYICQMAVRNSVEPEATFQLALSTLQSNSSFTSSGASVFEVWNRYSCHIATDFVEHQRELDLRAAAAEQSAATLSASTPVDTRPLSLRQIDLALKIDEDFAQKFTGSPWSTAYQFVLDRLMNHGHPGVKVFKQALLCMWRIGDREKFLESVLLALDGLLTDADDDAWHLVRLAYQEASILRRQSDAELLFNRICESPEQQRAMEEIASLSKQEAIDRQLTPMGKMGLRAANWDLSQAIASKNEWRDAGAMSLGFFRILELEFNERLIFPLVHQVDFADFERLFETLKSNATSSRTQNAIDFWKKMKSPLLGAKKSRKGLDLGALELFIQKIRSTSGDDKQIKELLRRALCSCLTPKGVEAFNAGELEALLNGQAREKYRNPAAHSRYVDLATARDCKTYVEDALDKLLLYTHTFQVEGLLH